MSKQSHDLHDDRDAAQPGETSERDDDIAAQRERVGESTAEDGEDSRRGDPTEGHDETASHRVADQTTTLAVVTRESAVGRWRAWVVAGLSLIGLGLFYGNATMLAGAAIPFAYVGYSTLSSLPSEVSLEIERTVPDERLTPGDPVEVTVTVTNTGDTVLPDVRLVDGVPDELAVVDGAPRGATSLRPGGQTAFHYTLVAKRGEFTFGDAQLVVRSLIGTDAATLSTTVTGVDRLSCTEPAGLDTLDTAAPLRVGQSLSDRAGEGLEFHSTREYRAGDSQSRINWRQYAKSGELVTTEFRQERAANEVLLVDVRAATRHSSSLSHPTGAEYGVYAAEVLLDHFRAQGHRVGVAVLGVEVDAVDAPVTTIDDALWVANATTPTGRRQARAIFEAAAEIAATRETTVAGSGRRDTLTPRPRSTDLDATHAERFLAMTPDDAELFIVSPMPDSYPLVYAKRAAVTGTAVTLFAPDHTGAETPGARLAGVHRSTRLIEARTYCRRVIDWPAERSLLTIATALAAADRGGV